MTKIIYFIIVIVSFSILNQGCGRNTDKETQTILSEYVSGLNNGDITWRGSYTGVDPVLSENAMRVFKILLDEHNSNKTDAKRMLFPLLKKPDCFVVAHVLLTKLQIGVEYEVSGDRWNGLKVILDNKGATIIDNNQMADIEKKWSSLIK